MASPPTASNAAYVFGAIVFGAITATSQTFAMGSAEWLGATLAPLLVGLLLGVVIRLFRKTANIFKIAFWWSIIAVAISAISPGR